MKTEAAEIVRAPRIS